MAKTFKRFKSESKTDWGMNYDDGQAPTNDQIMLGAILRIADAQEKMQISICGLQRIQKLEAEMRALKNYVRRLEKKMA